MGSQESHACAGSSTDRALTIISLCGVLQVTAEMKRKARQQREAERAEKAAKEVKVSVTACATSILEHACMRACSKDARGTAGGG